MKKTISLFAALTILLLLSVPGFAANTPNLSPEDFYDDLMGQPKPSFLERLSETCTNGMTEEIIVAAVALLERDDVSEDDLVHLISDRDAPYILRRIAVESYALRGPRKIDDTILRLISDSTEEEDLRTISVSLLSDYMGSSDINLLIATANSTYDNLSYNSIKALERIEPEVARDIALSIFDNYERESPARINIATKVLSRELYDDNQNQRTNNAELSEKEFVEKCVTILENTNNEEIQHVVAGIISSVSDNELPLRQDTRASGFQGYAAYRDGVTTDTINLNWHGAIIAGPETSMSYYIFAQARGVGSTTELGSYLDFIGRGEPKGYYRPSSTSYSASQRDRVCDTAVDLAYERIPYVMTNPISYSMSSIASKKYPISDILAIRCDGFVEYAFEYNNIRIYGSDENWDISKPGVGPDLEHSGFQLTPRKQANNCMVRMGSL